MTDPNNSTHVGLVVDRLKGIPPEKFTKKLGRTVAGVLLAVAALKAGPWLKAAEISHVKEITTVALVAGAVLASFEFIVLPLTIGLALAKDAVNIVVAFITRKRANGDGES